MKITKTQLKQIIKEEIERVMSEEGEVNNHIILTKDLIDPDTNGPWMSRIGLGEPWRGGDVLGRNFEHDPSVDFGSLASRGGGLSGPDRVAPGGKDDFKLEGDRVLIRKKGPTGDWNNWAPIPPDSYEPMDTPPSSPSVGYRRGRAPGFNQ